MPAQPALLYSSYLKSIQMKIKPMVRSIRALEQTFPLETEFSQDLDVLKKYLLKLEEEMLICIAGRTRRGQVREEEPTLPLGVKRVP